MSRRTELSDGEKLEAGMHHHRWKTVAKWWSAAGGLLVLMGKGEEACTIVEGVSGQARVVDGSRAYTEGTGGDW